MVCHLVGIEHGTLNGKSVTEIKRGSIPNDSISETNASSDKNDFDESMSINEEMIQTSDSVHSHTDGIEGCKHA